MLKAIGIHVLAVICVLAILVVLREKNASRIRNSIWGWLAIVWYPLLIAITAKFCFLVWEYWKLPSPEVSESKIILILILGLFAVLTVSLYFNWYLPKRELEKEWEKIDKILRGK